MYKFKPGKKGHVFRHNGKTYKQGDTVPEAAVTQSNKYLFEREQQKQAAPKKQPGPAAQKTGPAKKEADK